MVFQGRHGRLQVILVRLQQWSSFKTPCSELVRLGSFQLLFAYISHDGCDDEDGERKQWLLYIVQTIISSCM